MKHSPYVEMTFSNFLLHLDPPKMPHKDLSLVDKIAMLDKLKVHAPVIDSCPN